MVLPLVLHLPSLVLGHDTALECPVASEEVPIILSISGPSRCR